jgi:hypothetical protein
MSLAAKINVIKSNKVDIQFEDDKQVSVRPAAPPAPPVSSFTKIMSLLDDYL